MRLRSAALAEATHESTHVVRVNDENDVVLMRHEVHLGHANGTKGEDC